jgi:hypothetical protein
MNMKTNHKKFWSWQPAGLAALLLGAVVVLPVLAGTSDSKSPTTNQTAIVNTTDTDMRVEVLSLTVSKLERDDFGNAVSPFNDFGFFKEHSGTVVLAKITPPSSSPLKLLGERCRLIDFKDDTGTDLFTNASAGLGGGFFQGNRPLEILTTKDSGCFGVRIRSARLPARAATRLTADVLLTFAPTTGERIESKPNFDIKDGQVTTLGPLKIKLKVMPSSSYHRTNQPVARPQPAYWLASFLPEQGATILSVAFFSEKSDEPVLLVKNLDSGGKAGSSNTGFYKTGAEPGEAKDAFSNLVGYGFTPPEDGKATVKIRYLPTDTLVEKHCIISTGISP